MSYLQITGLVNADGSFISNPLYVTEEAPSAPYEPNSATSIAWVEVLDKSDVLLSRTPVVIMPACAHPISNEIVVDQPFVLAGSVELSEQASVVRVKVAENSVYEKRATEATPVIDIDWSEVTKAEAGQRKITWKVHHDNPKTLCFSVHARPKGEEAVLVQLSPWSMVNEALVSLEDLPGGAAELVLFCSDGFRNIEVLSAAIELPDPGCRACIYSPSDGAKVSSELPVRLWGSGYYSGWQGYHESQLLFWSSSLQGELGEGNDLWVRLEPGDHIIYLTAGGGKRSGSTQISIHVE